MTKKALIIDDAEGIRDAFILSLSKDDIEVDTASTGDEGLEKALKNKPDLIFLDLTMPGMNGIETMRKLLQSCPGVNIYIMTAFHQNYTPELDKARADGLVFELCHKPMGADQIRQIVNSILDE